MRKRKNKTLERDLTLTTIEPLNKRQDLVLKSKNNLVLSGYAGTGKTYLATYVGLRDIFNGLYSRIVFVRSAVPTRDLGFLKGTDKEKIEVYETPYIDIAAELFNRGDAYEIAKRKGLLFFYATSFMRGTNLRDAVVIVDEVQNMSYHELDTIITRLNDNCRIIFCGDMRQPDLAKNGMSEFYKVLRDMRSFDFVDFNNKSDIVRSDLVKEYIIKKEEILGKL